MKTKSLIVLLTLFVFVVAGCAGEGTTTATGGGTTGGGTTGGGTTGGGTAITTGTQGTQAASSGTQATSLTTGSNTVLSNLSNVGLSSVMGSAPRMTPSLAGTKDKGLAKAGKLSGKLSTSRAARNAAARVFAMKRNELGAIRTASIENCTDGGTVTATENSATSFTIAFDQCREGGIQYDGSVSLTDSSTATSYSFTETIGTTASPFTMLEFDSDAYLTLLSSMESAMTMAVSGTEGTLVMAVDGTMHVLDYIGQETYHMEFADYTNEMDLGITASALTLSITANGGFSEEWTEDGVPNALDAAFVNTTVATTITADYYDSTYSGQVSIDFTPDECFEGTFAFVTNTAIRYDNTLGYTTQGELVINGNTTITYNADGSITVTTGTSSTTYANEYELAALCDFQTLDEETSTTSGGTGVGNVAAAGTMTVTLTWENPVDVSNSAANTSDMDLHVNFYNSTAPSNATTGDWYVAYNSDICNSPFDDTTWDGVDLDADDVCDVGLDFDDTEGYGPEHITATTLPAGYYVVSVNSYSLDTDPSADISVMLQIGDTLFGPYTHTFDTYDYNGTEYTLSWFRVRDIRVNADGTVDVLAPDTTLNPRGYSPALASAAKKKK